MDKNYSKNKKLNWLIIIILALVGGPIGWLFLVIWIFSSGAKNKFKFKGGLLKDIHESNTHVNSQQISDINQQVTIQTDTDSHQGYELLRIFFIIISLIGITSVIVYVLLTP